MACLGAAAASAAATTDSSSTVLEEVVITAQKRTQNLKSVPISVSVLSGDETRIERYA